MDSYNYAHKLIYAFFGIVGLICVFLLIAAEKTALETGILRISTSSPGAVISIGQPNHQAKIIGIGKSSVRLKPGVYLVTAYTDKQHAATTIDIKAKKSIEKTLTMSSSFLIHSADDVSFNGLTSLTDHGLTDDQISSIRLGLFQFKPSENEVDIDSSSWSSRPHNPDVDTSFTSSFSVIIDGTKYRARVAYSGLEDISLLLYNDSGKKVFDSNTLER